MPEEKELVATVARGLGHRFNNPQLLLDALTHKSFVNERPREAPVDNDRLEFLGDAVLQWAVSALLWRHYPDAPAGEMTRRRADLVCEDGLRQVASELGIADALRLGKGEARSGGRDKPRLLSSALEACIAAVFLDGGEETALEVCRRLFEPRLGELAPGTRDFKTRLQEHLQREGRPRPRYGVEATTGPDHARRFRVCVRVDGDALAEGEGNSKGEAEQLAAELALRALGVYEE